MLRLFLALLAVMTFATADNCTNSTNSTNCTNSTVVASATPAPTNTPMMETETATPSPQPSDTPTSVPTFPMTTAPVVGPTSSPTNMPTMGTMTAPPGQMTTGSPSPTNGTTMVHIKAVITINGNYSFYEAASAEWQGMFRDGIAEAIATSLSIDANHVNVTSVSSGSIIVEYTIMVEEDKVDSLSAVIAKFDKTNIDLSKVKNIYVSMGGNGTDFVFLSSDVVVETPEAAPFTNKPRPCPKNPVGYCDMPEACEIKVIADGTLLDAHDKCEADQCTCMHQTGTTGTAGNITCKATDPSDFDDCANVKKCTTNYYTCMHSFWSNVKAKFSDECGAYATGCGTADAVQECSAVICNNMVNPSKCDFNSYCEVAQNKTLENTTTLAPLDGASAGVIPSLFLVLIAILQSLF